MFFQQQFCKLLFYSLEQSSSQNYGGIGTVIAHEISHAFDNNGAQFDKEGNLNKWWLDEDYEAFEEKQKEMIALFDGVETEAGPANGKLIVSENIADQGGITAALTAAKDEKDVDLKAFFSQWAKIWRMKASKEFQQMLLSMDFRTPLNFVQIFLQQISKNFTILLMLKKQIRCIVHQKIVLKFGNH